MLNLFPTHSVLSERALNSIEFRFDCTVQSANHLSIGITKSVVLEVGEQVEALLRAVDHVSGEAKTGHLDQGLDECDRQVGDVTVCAHGHSLHTCRSAREWTQDGVTVGPEALASGPTRCLFACLSVCLDKALEGAHARSVSRRRASVLLALLGG